MKKVYSVKVVDYSHILGLGMKPRVRGTYHKIVVTDNKEDAASKAKFSVSCKAGVEYVDEIDLSDDSKTRIIG